jgi:hypothetical protein
LSVGVATDSVSALAFRVGFLHLGRFAQDYWRRLGERLAETLQRALHRYGTATTFRPSARLAP